MTLSQIVEEIRELVAECDNQFTLGHIAIVLDTESRAAELKAVRLVRERAKAS